MISPTDMESTTGSRIRQSIKYLKIRIKGIGRKDKDRDLGHFSIQMDAGFKGIFHKT